MKKEKQCVDEHDENEMNGGKETCVSCAPTEEPLARLDQIIPNRNLTTTGSCSDVGISLGSVVTGHHIVTHPWRRSAILFVIN